MIRFALSLLTAVLLPAAVFGQPPAQETSSSFVNFNLNRINMVRSYLPQYNGAGLTASVKEFRYDTLDIDFHGRHIPHPRAAEQTDPHATLMATILGGAGNSSHTGRGVAWGAALTSSSFLTIFPDDDSYFEALGISVQNHSYGIEAIENVYGPIAAAYDLQVSRLPQLLHVFSIGNLGARTPADGPYAGLAGYANMTGEFKAAKNVLTLGVVDSSGIIDPFSSRGPAFDGRIKPELVAFGIGGSSAAAALASGTALLLQQAYLEAQGQLPAAALVKALLINSATDAGPAGADYTYGFGNIDAYRALSTLLAGHYRSDTLAYDETHSLRIEVPAGVEELKITLCWTDPPAPVYADKALINDLDLELVRLEDGRRRLPQVLSTFPNPDSLSRPAGTGKDHVNNVEQIVWRRPTPGAYEIRVEAFDFGVAYQVYHLAYHLEPRRDFRWTFPTGKDVLVPSNNFNERLYWEASAEVEEGALSVSLDGGAHWQLLSAETDLRPGFFSWFPPDTMSRALLRMQVGQQEYLSDTFAIALQPFLQFLLNCPDSVGLSWPRQDGAAGYQLYQLEQNYLEPFLLTTDTFAVIRKPDLAGSFVALAPLLPDGRAGARSFAYDVDQQPEQCYAASFSGEITGMEALLHLTLGTTYQVSALTLERQIQGRFVERQTIGLISGESYVFRDDDLRLGANIYRVRIGLAGGGTVYSPQIQLDYIQPDHFLLYPNPVSRRGSFQVRYNVEQPEEVRFQLYTAWGAEVLSLSIPELETAVFAEDFQSGMYFYRFVRDGKLLQSGKLVVR